MAKKDPFKTLASMSPEGIKKLQRKGLQRMQQVVKGGGRGSQFFKGVMEKNPSRVADLERGADPRAVKVSGGLRAGASTALAKARPKRKSTRNNSRSSGRG